jgi:hypothetical protein
MKNRAVSVMSCHASDEMTTRQIILQCDSKSELSDLDCVFRLGAGATTVCTVGVAGKLNQLSRRQLQDIFEVFANLHEDVSTLFS